MKICAEVRLTPLELAKAFCELNDEAQAQFFIECARIAGEWSGGLGADWQWTQVGAHLRTCSCSTDEARDMVRAIADYASGAPGGDR